MALATDDEGMACCFRPTLESPQCTAEWGIGEVIWYREVEFTARMLAAGHAVAALLAMWRGVEISVANSPQRTSVAAFRRSRARREEVLQRCARAHTQENVFDVFYAGNYGPGIDVHPFEVMYFKTNRGVQELQLQAYTEWQDPGFFTQEARHAFVAQRRVCPPPSQPPKRRLRLRGLQHDDAHLF
ncbi:hypothetical protein JKP88DRAFT_266246 [Tribonema minus]|uniref:Uncharacterized protein n=1 Tax=Tribonema minus TaxID=303371 RepID=A0A836CMV1_9STRA|nr:hypothetical protein JKP88DRAFT_266246 [Tribonema minus]